MNYIYVFIYTHILKGFVICNGLWNIILNAVVYNIHLTFNFQVVIDKWTRDFLREIGVDFDNMEGCLRFYRKVEIDNDGRVFILIIVKKDELVDRSYNSVSAQ